MKTGRRKSDVIEPMAVPGQNANAAGYRNMHQLIQLRWIAVVGQLSTIAVVSMGFGVQLPVPAMLQLLACLIAFNIFSLLRWKEQHYVDNRQLFLALLVDVFSLTMQLYLSGGMTNPFVFLYLLQVILAAVLLQPWSSWTIVVITGASVRLDLPLASIALQPEETSHAA